MFETEEECRRQIIQDKHTLLEGYVVEHLFENQFLKDGKTPCSKGWWMAYKGNDKFFFCLSEQRNEVNSRLENYLYGFPVWYVFFGEDKLIFYDGKNQYDSDEFCRKYSLNPIRKDLRAEDSTRNEERQKRCIDYFIRYHMLREVALQRYFADHFLTNYFNSSVNLDFLTISNKDELCVLEIKYKYESYKMEFGINLGQVKLFQLLSQKGLKVHHFILYNITKDKNLSIFGFLEKRDIKKEWVHCVVNDIELVERRAPRETSIDGKKEQVYYGIPKRLMSIYKELVVSE